MPQENGSTVQIHDVVVHQLKCIERSLDIYKYQDHLLPRVGLVQYQELLPNHPRSLQLRQVTDEVWCLLEGECIFLWQDLRQDSPTHSVIQKEKSNTPSLVLAPFGVAFGIHALSESRLLRIAAHDESEIDGSQTLPWPET